MNAAIDPYELARRHQALTGETPVSEFDRLLASLAGNQGRVRWQAEFTQLPDTAGEPAVGLVLTVRACLRVPCIRCVEATSHFAQLEQQFQLVADEGIASHLDQLLDDIDVLAAGRSFDLHALIEDELIMALPLMPRHEKCVEGAAAPAAPPGIERPAEERQLPFAGLAEQLAGSTGEPQIDDPPNPPTDPARKRRH